MGFKYISETAAVSQAPPAAISTLGVQNDGGANTVRRTPIGRPVLLTKAKLLMSTSCNYKTSGHFYEIFKAKIDSLILTSKGQWYL